jgi:hypothetical protein
MEGARDEVGRRDVVVLVLQQLAYHVGELDRAIDDEDVLALHLLRRRASAAVHGSVPSPTRHSLTSS